MGSTAENIEQAWAISGFCLSFGGKAVLQDGQKLVIGENLTADALEIHIVEHHAVEYASKKFIFEVVKETVDTVAAGPGVESFASDDTYVGITYL